MTDLGNQSMSLTVRYPGSAGDIGWFKRGLEPRDGSENNRESEDLEQ